MIGWLQSADVAVFRFVNSSLSNRFFDWLMPFLSGSPWIALIILGICAWLMIAGGARGRFCVLMLALTLCFGNWMVCDSIKNLIARPRPFLTLTDVHLRIGMGGSFSMPSSHAANWFSAALIFFIYYRRSIWFTLPLAFMVALSRIYNGVHYPSDSLAGMALGLGYSAGICWGLEMLWQWAGPKWFPAWHERMPSLLDPIVHPNKSERPTSADDAQWLRLGYLLTALFFVLRLAYLGLGNIELTQDEAYQWIWSKHLDWSYYSKPPLIALAQFTGTHIFGDTAFGVRFLSPVIAAILSILALRFLAREINGKTAFVTFLVITVTPLTALGATIMTVDPLSVLFWTCAMVAGWRASQPAGTTRQWLWVGLWIGLGFLSKYTNLLQAISFLLFFAFYPPARRQLRRPGPYLALAIALLCCLPVIVWNAHRGWITVHHVAEDGRLGETTHRTYVLDFLLSEAAVMHPLFFVAAIWAALAFWRGREPLSIYLFCMGAPVFLIYFALSWHARVQPNWVAPSVIPLFCLMSAYWSRHFARQARWLRPVLCVGLFIGAAIVVFLYAPNLLGKILQRNLPANLDLLHRAHGWEDVAERSAQARRDLEAEGKPVFFIGQDYGITSEVSFYLPSAKERVRTDPLVYFYTAPAPQNQFYFWPNYLNRKGQNAIFIRALDRPPLRSNWFSLWWHHQNDIYQPDNPAYPLPREVQAQFASCTDLGVVPIIYKGELVRRLQLFACHNLHGQ